MTEIIYTCPICGHDLQEVVLTSLPPQYRKICNHCGYTYTEQSSAVRVPFIEPTNPLYSDSLTAPASDICKCCTNHPSNGGSGICHCTLGTPVIS